MDLSVFRITIHRSESAAPRAADKKAEHSEDAALNSDNEFIAAQIIKEDGLINYRLTWTLTLNGLLATALGLGGKVGAGQLFDWPMIVAAIPYVAFFVSLAGLGGISAALVQLGYLCKRWRDDHGASTRLRPFGDKWVFALGTLPSLIPSFAMAAFWLFVISNRWFPDIFSPYLSKNP